VQRQVNRISHRRHLGGGGPTGWHDFGPGALKLLFDRCDQLVPAFDERRYAFLLKDIRDFRKVYAERRQITHHGPGFRVSVADRI
jgi:hypothetical protein